MLRAGRLAGTPRLLSGPAAVRGSAGVVCLLLALTGCRATKPDTRYDLLESELRTRERELVEARGEAARLRALAQAFGQPVGPGGPACDPQPGRFRQSGRVPTVPLKDINLASGTGGVDEDGRPGDESLSVVIAPRDDDGTVVKVPGAALIRAYEVAPSGIKTPLGQWEVSPEQLRRTWKSGLLSSGYVVPLQWDRPPAEPRLRIIARFVTADGRQFEADKEVTVQPLAGRESPPSYPESRPANELPPPGTDLPPRPVEPGPGRADELPPPPAKLRWRGVE